MAWVKTVASAWVVSNKVTYAKNGNEPHQPGTAHWRCTTCVRPRWLRSIYMPSPTHDDMGRAKDLMMLAL
jgi:hypothetical protein